ncbi:hypothetical protein [Bradyrhizobium prioriisuperbiae]|uniref:hypothetical protein n=1 Tax=Bradyrhizobium prioriisuperbiae TaxID=2854389 RepID=UPI0028E91357|nr:hypothetical protein [Bradyrhizobium prioritasuperba]
MERLVQGQVIQGQVVQGQVIKAKSFADLKDGDEINTNAHDMAKARRPVERCVQIVELKGDQS